MSRGRGPVCFRRAIADQEAERRGATRAAVACLWARLDVMDAAELDAVLDAVRGLVGGGVR